jgi:hypothetical protein
MKVSALWVIDSFSLDDVISCSKRIQSRTCQFRANLSKDKINWFAFFFLVAIWLADILLDINGKSLHQQLYELKVKTHTLRNDFISIRRMQQSLQENFKTQLQVANKKIEVNWLIKLIISIKSCSSFF